MVSLFVEQQDNGLSFYINGDLQFNTHDEKIYHEYLVIPSLILAVNRFPDTPLKVLICGGGDGLAVREVLKFSSVELIDLVDYNPDVIKLGKTTFKDYNQNSLFHEKVSIYIQDAFTYLDTIPQEYYHVILCDFTYPTTLEESKIYSLDWFNKVKSVLNYKGIIATNAVSPTHRTTAFWCLYQTLLHSELNAKPLHVAIPSFLEHGYGEWGFFLGSPLAIQSEELFDLNITNYSSFLDSPQILNAFIFDTNLTNLRHNITIDSLQYPQLFYYLLNPLDFPPELLGETLNFLSFKEKSNGQLGRKNNLTVESISQLWVEQISHKLTNNSQGIPQLNLQQLLPIQHRYHNQKMQKEWINYYQKILGEINWNKLLNAVLKKAKNLPNQITLEVEKLIKSLEEKTGITHISAFTLQFLIGLSVTLLLANIIHPDSVFAKGYYYGGDTGGYNGSPRRYNRSPSYNTPSRPLNSTEEFGLQLVGIGVLLLIVLGLTYVMENKKKYD